MPNINPPQIVELSAQLIELDGRVPSEIKLVPAGAFRSARDNRPENVPAWIMSADNANAIVARQNQLKTKFLIDYEHQTLAAKTAGIKAPAAGWGGRLEWRDGDGLYAVDMDWNASAKAAIAAREYRYISPVIASDALTGQVTGVLMAALVNYPALDDLTDLAAAAALLYAHQPDETPMKKQLSALLGLPEDADEAAVLAAVTALKAAPEQVTALAAQVEQLKAQAPDPALYMPTSIVTELQAQLAALSAKQESGELDKLIEANINKLPTPGLIAWAKGQSVAALSAFLDNAPEIAALSGMQTAGKAPDAPVSGETLVAACAAQWNTSPSLRGEFATLEDYTAFKKAEAAGKIRNQGGK